MILRQSCSYHTKESWCWSNLFNSEKRATSWRKWPGKDTTMHKSKPETVSHRRVTHFPEAPQRNSEARKTLDGHKAHKTAFLLLLSRLQIQKVVGEGLLKTLSFLVSTNVLLQLGYYQASYPKTDAEQEADRISQSYLQTSVHFLLIKASFGYFVRSNHCLKPVMQTTKQGRPQPEPGRSVSLNSRSR